MATQVRAPTRAGKLNSFLSATPTSIAWTYRGSPATGEDDVLIKRHLSLGEKCGPPFRNEINCG